MSFLAPLFLLGGAAVLFPLVFHLIRRTTRQRTQFSSLLFLPPSPPRVTQRSRLEDLLLLALRCLILALLAFGFARPFLKRSAMADPSARPPRRVVLLLDTSASMRRPGLWDAARERALRHARALTAADELAAWTFDRQSRPLVAFTEWQATPFGERDALLRSRMADVEPGWGATHLDDALAAASELLVETADRTAPGPMRVVVITDFQEGSRLDRLQAFDWPRGVEVAVEPVKPSTPGNAGLQLVLDPSTLNPGTQAVVRVRVVNAPDSTEDRFDVGWAGADGYVGRAEEVRVPPGQTRTVALAVPEDESASQILLRGDDVEFDNRVFIVPPRTLAVPALYFGNESPDEARQPLFYLLRALPSRGTFAVHVNPHPPGGAPDSTAIEGARFYFVADPVSPAIADRLAAQVRGGKTLVVAPRSAETFASLAPVLGGGFAAATEVQPRNYAMLGAVDFSHPLLAPFADPRYSDFTGIHFWRYRRLEPPADARVIWRFDSGDPALMEQPLGEGRAFVLASGWHPDDSQLALSTKFVPLLFSMIELGSHASGAALAVVTVGDPVPLPETADECRIRLPDGTESVVPAAAGVFTNTAIPGIYTAVSGDDSWRFAVNIDGAESRSQPLALETLEGFGAPVRTEPVGLEGPTSERKIQLAAIEAEGRQKLWRWLVLAALVVLLVESAVAAWQSRRMATGEERAP